MILCHGGNFPRLQVQLGMPISLQSRGRLLDRDHVDDDVNGPRISLYIRMHFAPSTCARPVENLEKRAFPAAISGKERSPRIALQEPAMMA
jgi:hypothetical protein